MTDAEKARRLKYALKDNDEDVMNDVVVRAVFDCGNPHFEVIMGNGEDKKVCQTHPLTKDGLIKAISSFKVPRDEEDEDDYEEEVEN